MPGAKTPLLYATRRGDLAVTRLLVEARRRARARRRRRRHAAAHRDPEREHPAARGARRQSSSTSPSRVTSSNAARTSTPRTGTARRRSGPPSTSAISTSGPQRDNGIDRAAALELITLLLARGADPNARTREYPPERRFITPLGSLSWVDFTGQTPFLRAALAGDVTVMRLLLAHGADPNIATFAGTTPLMVAAGVNWAVAQTFDEGPRRCSKP